MGVVYKLNQDVIDFIIQQKSDNPSISCRKLAALASGYFQKKISKSSVNNVLKDADLSSSVGRRPSEKKKKKKFEIPPEKKERLFERVDRDVDQNENLPPEQKKTESQTKKEMLSPGRGQTEQKGKQPVDKGAPETDPFGDRLKEEVRAARKEREAFKSGQFDDMGVVFFKAAQWELAEQSMLADLIKKHLSQDKHEGLANTCETWLALKATGADSPEKIGDYSNSGAWPLDDKEGGRVTAADIQWLDDASFSRSLVLEYLNERQQAFLNINGYHIFLEDGTQLTVDAQMGSFWRRKYGSTLSLSMHKAIANMSEQIISNVRPAVVGVLPKDPELMKFFVEFAQAFSGIPEKKIKKVTIFGDEGEDLAEFTAIPGETRDFLIGVDPSHKMLPEISKAAKWAAKKPFYHKALDRVVFYTETHSDVLKQYCDQDLKDLTVVTIWIHKDEAPEWTILYNNPNMKTEEALEMYVINWPNFKNGYVAKLCGEPAGAGHEQPVVPLAQKSSDQFKGVDDIFNDYVEVLSKRVLSRYFMNRPAEIDVKALIREVYRLKGKLSRHQGVLGVFLEVPEDFKDIGILKSAVERVNESSIFDHTGHRLLLEMNS